MELRHLRYFVAVAEELNFTRAAERLGIKQPPLSLQIQQLEKEMGTALLRRRTRGVELTGAGKLLLEQARTILEQVEHAKTDVRRRARGDTGQMYLGTAGATYFHPFVGAIVREFRKEYPGVILSPEASNTPTLIARVHAGTIDAAFVRTPAEDCAGLAIVPIVEEDTIIALPEGHALTRSASVSLAALAKETFILCPRRINAGLYDSILAACAGAGFQPILGQEAPQLIATIPMVAGGFGISLVPRSLSRVRLKGVLYLPIKGDRPRAPISLAHRRDDRSPAVKNFVSLIRRSVPALV